jgi:hypothetical protein
MILMRLPCYPLMLALCALAASCAESTQHDENLAAKRAIEFAQVTFIDKNLEQAYGLLSPGGKRHISLDKFKEAVTRLHPRGFPVKVIAKEYQPMPGEKALWIYLTGQSGDDQFQYRLTMEATGNGDYQVLTIDSGTVGLLFSPSSAKKAFAKPISTQP